MGCQDLILTKELYHYLRHFKNFIFSFSSLDNSLVDEGFIDIDKLKYKSFNDNLFLLAEYEYNNFVINSYGRFMLWLIYLLIILIVTSTEFLFKECSRWRS